MNSKAHMWSEAELVEMFRFRIEGRSLQEIGDRFGITRERARQILNKPHAGGIATRCVYPAIRRYLETNVISQKDFAERIGVSNSGLTNVLLGKHLPNKRMIDKILHETGLTYEEAFRTDADR